MRKPAKYEEALNERISKPRAPFQKPGWLTLNAGYWTVSDKDAHCATAKVGSKKARPG